MIEGEEGCKALDGSRAQLAAEHQVLEVRFQVEPIATKNVGVQGDDTPCNTLTVVCALARWLHSTRNSLRMNAERPPSRPARACDFYQPTRWVAALAM